MSTKRATRIDGAYEVGARVALVEDWQEVVIDSFDGAADQDRSREFYQSVFDGKVVRERDPVSMKVAKPSRKTTAANSARTFAIRTVT